MPVHPHKSRPRIALAGRTNVGKSTLWNRLTENGNALVSKMPHTTRDRKTGLVVWRGSCFDLVDAGGMDVEKGEMGQGIRAQAERAAKEADIVLFVVDAQAGILPQDYDLANRVKHLNKNVLLVANKTDKASHLSDAAAPEMFRLGFGDPKPISGVTGLGIGDLLDELLTALDRLGKPAVALDELQPLRFVIVGRPNVGKSSLVNAILGEERVIVSPIPHTTREPQDTLIRYKDRDIILVDTAGIRKATRNMQSLEEQAMERNERVIKHADVAALVFDASEDPTTWDRHLAGMLEDTDKGLILVANKWDLVPDKKTDTAKKYEVLLRQLFPFLAWAPMVFVSAKTAKRATVLLDMALQAHDERMRHISYNTLNKLLKSCIKAMKPLQSYGPKSPRIYDVAQIGHAPPSFLITVHGEKENLHNNWVKFFEKRLREKFGFGATPLSVKVRHLPMAKTQKARNVFGPGMDAVAGPIKEKKRRVNQTMRRQKQGGHRY